MATAGLSMLKESIMAKEKELSEHQQKQQKDEQGKDLRPEKGIFLPAAIGVLVVALPMMLFPDQSERIIGYIYTPFSIKFGSLYLWITVGLIFLGLYFALTRYGNIKFGDPNEEPEYSMMSWLAMIFCSGVAGDVMFWAVAEPLWDVLTPPQYATPMSTEAYDWALSYMMLHWGPNAWITYFVSALPITYLFHIRRRPVLRISAAAGNILGKQTNGIIGRVCDVFFILGLLFCTAVTMCVSLPTVTNALGKVFGLTPSFRIEVCVLIFSSCLAAWSVWSGLKKGIKVLSNINVCIALIMLAYTALVGPTSSLFDIFTNAFGKLLGNYWNMHFWTSPFSTSTFPRDWTIFYALFWAGYGPFMGLFIARVSRGRTIREVVLIGLLGTCGCSYIIHGVLASYTLYVQYHGIIDAVSILKESGGPAAIVAVIGTLPFGKFVMLGYCMFSTIFLATSVDSSCYIISSVATKRMGIFDDPARWQRVFWAFVQAMLGLGLLSIGGIGVAKIFGNFSGALMALPVILLTLAWLKIIKTDGRYLLYKFVPKIEFSEEELKEKDY